MKQSTINKLLKLNRELYEKETSAWSKTRKEIWEKNVIDFVKKIPAGSCVLDLGCGNARLYQKFTKKKINYLGIDLSKKLIAYDKKDYPDVKFEIGNGLNLKYINKFDYIISIAVLHHIPGRKLQIKFLRNCYDALKPNGKLCLTVWSRWQDKYKKYFLITKPYPDMAKNDLIVPWENTKYKRFIHAFTKKELENLAKNSSFLNTDCYYSDKNGKTNKNNGLNIILTARK
jgi:tRNA (uracil-5-)-methyltransferase TRM9